jgi:hypothetical protein
MGQPRRFGDAPRSDRVPRRLCCLPYSYPSFFALAIGVRGRGPEQPCRLIRRNPAHHTVKAIILRWSRCHSASHPANRHYSARSLVADAVRIVPIRTDHEGTVIIRSAIRAKARSTGKCHGARRANLSCRYRSTIDLGGRTARRRRPRTITSFRKSFPPRFRRLMVTSDAFAVGDDSVMLFIKGDGHVRRDHG